MQPFICRKIKTIDAIIIAATAVIIGAIILTAKNPAAPPAAPLVASPAAKVAALYYSVVKTTQYCDGAVMDTASYAKTLVQKMDLPTPATAQTPEAQFLYVVNAGVTKVGATYSCPDFFLKDLEAKFSGQTAYLYSPGGGWAGVSIAMCSCEPFLEKNLAESFGIAKTVWVDSQAELDAVK